MSKSNAAPKPKVVLRRPKPKSKYSRAYVESVLHELADARRRIEGLERLLGAAHASIEEQRARRLALEEEAPFVGMQQFPPTMSQVIAMLKGLARR